MKSTRTILMITIILGIGLIVAFSRTRTRVTQIPQTISRTPEQQLTLQRTVTTQRRFNRYFQQDVTPRLKDCWARIKGRGSVEIQYTYRKDPSGKWVTDHLAIKRSTLPRGQEVLALQCMQDSVRNTNLPSDSGESTYVLFWNWSVPLPSSFPLTAIDNDPFPPEGGGGCDGKGQPARCWLCLEGHCQPACFGGEACMGGGRTCRVRGDCGTGGIYGVMGQATIQ
jgi:hypothetical protein